MVAQPGVAPTMAGAPPEGARTHDGFYARALFGPGYSSMTAKGVDQKIAGIGSGMVAALGGVIRQRFAVFAEVSVDSNGRPEIEVGDTTTKTGTADTLGYGAGVAYFFMPLNVFVAGSGLMVLQSLSKPGEDGAGITAMGGGVSLTIGKEWWAGKNLGLGVAARGFAAGLEDWDADMAGKKSSWTILAASLGFSATFN